MKWPGISLKTMMFVIAILAADFGFFSYFDLLSGLFSDDFMVVIGLLPMANIIALGLPRLLWLGLPRLFRRMRRMPFSIGFQVTSWVSTLVVLTVVFLQSEAIIELMNRFFNTFYQQPCLTANRSLPPAAPPLFDLFESLCVLLDLDLEPENWFYSIGSMAFFSLPPLLVSLAGGLITHFVVRRQLQRKSA